MAAWLVSYADASFRLSQSRLARSARRWGIEQCRSWTRDELRQTPFFAAHRAILDRPRGSGYWLWKPFIIGEVLERMGAGEPLVYCDAGIDIVADLSPLFRLSARQDGVLLFAGHYDDFGGTLGPNTCGRWTKRDCFVRMGCDAPRYHDAPLLDASCIVLGNTPRARALVREWLELCCRAELLTDDANVCGRPNLAGFRDHRHDQSILSLMAARDGVELFRHPSQHGNHAKREDCREPGEWLRHPYGSKGVFLNSPYKTLLHHHRGALGPEELRLVVRARLNVPRERLFASWMSREVLYLWAPPGWTPVPAQAIPSGDHAYEVVLVEGATRRELRVNARPVDCGPGHRFVYPWISQTRVTAEFRAHGSATDVEVTEEGCTDERTRHMHEEAWAAFFDRLGETLGERA